ncbi:retrovirus-related pol polyprotein from transposon TNT 1-94 [Tanacetum coccineum]
MEQHRLKSKTFKVKMNQVLNENERLLKQVLSKDIVNIIVNSSVNNPSVNVHECEKCLQLETELQTNFIEKEIYDKLFKSFTTLEKHCISLEVDSQLNQEIFQRDNSVSNQSAPSFDQFGKTNKDKIKQELEEIETINIELDHRVTKLIAEEIFDLNACLQEKVLVITALKNDLRKLKGKALVVNDVTKHPSDPEMLKIDVEPITPKLLNKQTAHSAYIKHTQEEATVLRDLVEHVQSKYPLDQSLESALAVTPKNKDKRVRFTEPVTSSGNTITKTTSTSNLVSNKPMLSSTGVKPSTSASGSQPSGNTKKDKIRQTPSSTQMNKVEAHPRKVKSSFKNKDCVVQPKGTAHVQHSKLNANSELKCVKCNGCMLSDNHDLCVLDFINNVNARNARTNSKSVKKNPKRNKFGNQHRGRCLHILDILWRPTGRTFTIVGNKVGISHETYVARSPQQNGVVERRNHTLIEAARTMLIFAKAPLFLWAEAVATAYFDELTVMASEHNSLGPTLHDMTPATISSGLVLNPHPSTPFVPPLRIDWDILIQPLFNELITPPPSVDCPTPEVIALITEITALEPTVSTGSPSSTTVDQDVPSPSKAHKTTPELNLLFISNVLKKTIM